jgi:hypothetical protein
LTLANGVLCKPKDEEQKAIAVFVADLASISFLSVDPCVLANCMVESLATEPEEVNADECKVTFEAQGEADLVLFTEQGLPSAYIFKPCWEIEQN